MAISGITNHVGAYQGSESSAAVESVKYGKVVQTSEVRASEAELPVADREKIELNIVPKRQEETQDQDAIKRAVEQFNKKMGNMECQYGIHEATNRVTIRIIDKDTREIVREVPPEKTLEMIAKVWELAGILVDEKR